MLVIIFVVNKTVGDWWADLPVPQYCHLSMSHVCSPFGNNGNETLETLRLELISIVYICAPLSGSGLTFLMFHAWSIWVLTWNLLVQNCFKIWMNILCSQYTQYWPSLKGKMQLQYIKNINVAGRGDLGELASANSLGIFKLFFNRVKCI